MLPVRVDDDTARLHTVVVHMPSRQDPSVLGKALDKALSEEERLFRAKLERHYKPAFPAELGDPRNINIQRYSDQHKAFITLLQDHGIEILHAEPVQGCVGPDVHPRHGLRGRGYSLRHPPGADRPPP